MLIVLGALANQSKPTAIILLVTELSNLRIRKGKLKDTRLIPGSGFRSPYENTQPIVGINGRCKTDRNTIVENNIFKKNNYLMSLKTLHIFQNILHLKIIVIHTMVPYT